MHYILYRIKRKKTKDIFSLLVRFVSIWRFFFLLFIIYIFIFLINKCNTLFYDPQTTVQVH